MGDGNEKQTNTNLQFCSYKDFLRSRTDSGFSFFFNLNKILSPGIQEFVLLATTHSTHSFSHLLIRQGKLLKEDKIENRNNTRGSKLAILSIEVWYYLFFEDITLLKVWSPLLRPFQLNVTLNCKVFLISCWKLLRPEGVVQGKAVEWNRQSSRASRGWVWEVERIVYP